jgi:hypothetical protein
MNRDELDGLSHGSIRGHVYGLNSSVAQAIITPFFGQPPQIGLRNENSQKSCSHHIEAPFEHCEINCKKTVTLALAK